MQSKLKNNNYRILDKYVWPLLGRIIIGFMVIGMIFGGIESCSRSRSSEYYDSIEGSYAPDEDEYSSARGRL